MRTKTLTSIALTILILLSALCLVRPEGKNHDKGILAAELTLETTQDGNQERQTYVNSDGDPVIPLDRDYATLLRTKDDDGNVVLEQYLDAQGEPVVRSGNYAAVSYRRGAGEIQITYLDAQLNPTTITSGYSGIDRTLTPEEWALRDTYFDLQGKPVRYSGGYYGLLRGYDDQGRVREIVYLDANGNPTRIKAGYSREARVLDDAGQIAAVYYRDAENNPVRASQGQYGEGYQRDENGRVTLITYLDAAGNPAPMNAGYTMLSRSYYRDGYPFEDRYFDADGNPFALSKGQYGICRVGDATLQLNRNGRLMLSIDNLLNGMPVMVVLVGCLLCVALCCLPRKPRVILLAAYVVFIFYETLMFRETGDPRTALIPFSYLGRFRQEYGVRLEVVNNIWLFVPLGAGLYTFAPRRRVLWIPVALTVGIELTQYLTGLGLMQADDILGNTFGAVVGFLLADRLFAFGIWLKNRAANGETG